MPGEHRDKIVLDDNNFAGRLYGQGNHNLKRISAELGVELGARGNEISVNAPSQDALRLCKRIIEELYSLVKRNYPLNASDVERAILILRNDEQQALAPIFLDTVYTSSRGKSFGPKGLAQKEYLDAIKENDIVFGIGPAGTGKTFMAMASAVASLARKEVKRIVLCRPAVEAGEKLGFLPGDMAEKVNPYLRPLYDALNDMMDPERAKALLADGVIEVAPLAFMRGRAQPLSSKVLTHNGWREIGSLNVGEYVIGSDGKPTQVLGVYPQGKKEVFRVTMTDGSSTLCCAEHLWTVYRNSSKEQSTLETRELMNLFSKEVLELPLLSGPVRFATEEPLPTEPRIVGLALRDFDEDNVAVPTAYLYRSPAERIALLQGLLDTDGALVFDEEGACHIQYATTSKQLCDDILFLVRSLGGVAHHRVWLAPLEEQGRLPEHILELRLPVGVEPFSLEKKASQYAKTQRKLPKRFIKSIELSGSEETICIRVAAPDSLYVTDDFILTHNTLNDSFVILDEAQNTTPEQMKMFLTRLGYDSKAVITGDITQIDLPNSQRSGLLEAKEILQGVQGLKFCYFGDVDVVRHPLVQEIIRAYDRFEALRPPKPRGQREPRRESIERHEKPQESTHEDPTKDPTTG